MRYKSGQIDKGREVNKEPFWFSSSSSKWLQGCIRYIRFQSLKGELLFSGIDVRFVSPLAQIILQKVRSNSPKKVLSGLPDRLKISFVNTALRNKLSLISLSFANSWLSCFRPQITVDTNKHIETCLFFHSQRTSHFSQTKDPKLTCWPAAAYR